MTTVLIHGGGSSSRFWDRLVPLIDGLALAVDMPGRGDKPGDLATQTVEDEAASIVADVVAVAPDGPVVVVAHSSGGLVVPAVASALDGRVTRIVLNAASVPPEGGCGLDCMQERHRDGVMLAVDIAKQSGEVLTTAGPPEDPEAFRKTYGGEPLDDDTLAFVVDPVRCVKDTLHHYFQPVHWSQIADVPVTYVVNLHDRPIPLALQEEMLGRLPTTPEVIRLDCGHIPPITHPHDFATIVNRTDVLPVISDA